MAEQKLLPCPHDGEPVEVEVIDSDWWVPERWYEIWCRRCGDSMVDYERDALVARWNQLAASAAGATKTISAVLSDSAAVYQALSEQARRRTSQENVSDVLDAVVRLLRAADETGENG